MGGGNGRHVIEGMLHRHLLSTGMAAYPANSDGVPFDMSHIYASGNIAADMYCNVAAEATGRVLAVRLYNATKDPGMKDMLHFMIARDTMHQQQWLAVIEELGGMPARCRSRTASRSRGGWPQQLRLLRHRPEGLGGARAGRWTHGPSLDGKGQYTVFKNVPMGEAPDLGPARPDSGGRDAADRLSDGSSAGTGACGPVPADRAGRPGRGGRDVN